MRPRYADLFKALLDEDPRRSDTAYDAVLFDRGDILGLRIEHHGHQQRLAR